MTELRHARDELSEALREVEKTTSLGGDVSGQILQIQANLAAPISGEELARRIADLPKQREIERIRSRRERAEGIIVELRRRVLHALKAIGPHDDIAQTVSENITALSPYPTIDNADTIITLLDSLSAPVPRVAAIKRTAPDDALAEVRYLVKKMHGEGFSHEEICKRLGNSPRPPAAKWSHLNWDAAYRNPKHREAVKTKLSKLIHE